MYPWFTVALQVLSHEDLHLEHFCPLNGLQIKDMASFLRMYLLNHFYISILGEEPGTVSGGFIYRITFISNQ